MVLNYIWITFFIVGFVVAVCKALTGETGLLSEMLSGVFGSAKTGFEISLGLTGIMTLWLGIMKIGEKAGVIGIFARGVAPFFRTLFRGVPKDHPANGSIIMNFSANMLGLDNAATPLGLKAMNELQELNPEKERASDAQIMFLVMNTAGLTLIPTSVIAIRQTIALQQGVTDFNAADIFMPTLIATFFGFLVGLLTVAAFQRLHIFRLPVLLFISFFALLILLMYWFVSHAPAEQVARTTGAVGAGIILLIIVLFITAGALKRQNVYDHFIEGAKEGFQVAVRIIPYLVAMLVAISVFRTSGCMQYLVDGAAWLLARCGLDTDFVPALPVALMKPLSGSGARGLMVDVMNEYGVASFPARVAAVIQGSTETTFYVLAVYFGSVNVKNTRYALTCGLIADAAGLCAAIILSYLFFH